MLRAWDKNTAYSMWCEIMKKRSHLEGLEINRQSF